MPRYDHSQLRYMAPVALVVCAIVVLGIIAGSGGGSDSSSSSGEPKQERQASSRGDKKTTKTTTGSAPSKRGVYTVKSGDSLGAIAEKVGQPVDKLQELNPDLDPQALISGQKVKLRQ